MAVVEDKPGATNELSELIDREITRRGVIGGGIAAAVGAVFLRGSGSLLEPTAAAAHGSGPRGGHGHGHGQTTLGFVPVAASTSDTVVVPQGYVAQVLYRWGDPINGRGGPAFKLDASNTAADQAQQAGMGHDGIEFFELGGWRHHGGLLAMNHEFAENFLLFPDGDAAWSASKTEKSQNAHGVSIVEVEYERGQWKVVPSRYARRITASTPMMIAGPASGHPLLRTAADPHGRDVRGTANNCAVGKTPWGTFLTCEENFNSYFGTADTGFTPSPLMEAYGFATDGFGPDWWKTDSRFDLATEANESNRYGWVVEFDPFQPGEKPVKRTALGRFKHENALVTETGDGRVVVYTGDDERGEFMYKFVGNRSWRELRRRRRDPLDEGTLYVARFDNGPATGDGKGLGTWLPLVHSQPGLTPADGFADQGEVLVKARLAARAVGATRMDRPEWVARDPKTGTVYLTLTNNSQRGSAYPTDDANPRANNTWGHIVRWRERKGDHAATTFEWDIFVLAGDPSQAHGATPGIDAFGSPDGVRFDDHGRLWIQTDGGQPIACNNQMLVADPESGAVKRFLVGPKGCEITGIAFTPDHRTVFVNIQHPGEGGTAADPRAVSNWPDFDPNGRPRDATIAIRRADGGVVGT